MEIQESVLVLSFSDNFCDDLEVYLVLNSPRSTNSKMTNMGLFILKHLSKELVRKISEDLISSCPLMML